jgi:hypothetical protein
VLRIRALLYLLMASVLVSGAAALGIAPGSVSLPYSPGDRDLSFLIVNTAETDITVGFLASGELRLSVPESISMLPGEQRNVVVRLSVPVGLAPGQHSAILGAYEMIESDATVAAAAGVISRLSVDVPYPGHYLEQEIRVTEKDIVVSVRNMGDLDTEVAPVLDISSDGKSIKTLTADSKLLHPGETREFARAHSLAKGSYAVISHAEFARDAVLAFNISEPVVYVRSHSAIRSGDYYEIRVDAASDWNMPIEAYATLESGSYSTMSSTVVIPASGSEQLRLYWPVSEDRNVTLVVHHSGKTDLARFVIEEPKSIWPFFALVILAALLVITVIWRRYAKR